jgi:hypothetical protein
MKQWSIFFLTVFMSGVLTVTASASTIPVNITPGRIVQISGQSAASNDLNILLGANFNDRVALGLGYVIPSNYFTVSGRYAFAKNMAASLSYANSSPIAWKIDFRMKYDFDEALAVAGVLGYDGAYPAATGQAEYWFSEQLAGNIGFHYQASQLSLVLGGELVADRIDIGLDCRFPGNDDAGQSQVVLFVAYKL